MVVLLVFWGPSILFSTVAVPIYIPTNSGIVFPVFPNPHQYFFFFALSVSLNKWNNWIEKLRLSHWWGEVSYTNFVSGMCVMYVLCVFSQNKMLFLMWVLVWKVDKAPDFPFYFFTANFCDYNVKFPLLEYLFLSQSWRQIPTCLWSLLSKLVSIIQGPRSPCSQAFLICPFTSVSVAFQLVDLYSLLILNCGILTKLISRSHC